MFGELVRQYALAQPFGELVGGAVFGERLGINLNIGKIAVLRQVLRVRIKIADTAFIEILPFEQNKIAEAIHKYRNSLKQTFIQIVVNGSAAGKRYFAFAGRASEKNSNAHKWDKVKDKTYMVLKS